jgi:[ribosomal protein S5]-alanine N-acetyltransferase
MIGLPLETKRLRIRQFEPERDARPLHELWGDPEAMRFISGGASTSVEETRERLARASERTSAGWGFWALAKRQSGQLVGGVGLFPLAWKGPEIELAYHIVPSSWNRGYASEAVRALLDAAWRETELDQIVAVVLPENAASTRVLEKVGLSSEGQARYRGFDVVRYSIKRPSLAAHAPATSGSTR